MAKRSATEQSPKSESDPAVFLLYGDEFLVKEQAQPLIDRLLPDELRSTNLIVLDGTRLDLGELSSHLFTSSLFGGPRVVVVEQTPLFLSRSDHGKLVDKITDAWKTGDRKAALRVFGQFVASIGVTDTDALATPDWTSELLPPSLGAEARELLATVGTEFLAEGRTTSRATDEGGVEDLIRSGFPDGTFLVFTAVAVDRRKKIFKAVETHGRVIECAAREERYGGGLERPFFDQRVRDAMKVAGKTIGPQALDAMYARTGTDLRRLHSELEKLVGYVGARRDVTAEDVEAVFGDFHEAGTFAFASAFRSADLAKCLPALHESLKTASHPLQTLGTMAAEVRKLMICRELLFTVLRPVWNPRISWNSFAAEWTRIREEQPDLANPRKHKLFAMKEYALYLYLKDAQRFPMEHLVAVMEAILEADVLMKSTRLGSHAGQAILERVVYTMCRPSSGRNASGARRAEGR